jgi:branched-chain amino acid transport system substrate-binding protein
MKRARWLLAIILVVVVGAAIAIVYSLRKPTTGDVVIGVVLPLTGDGATYGKEIKAGIELAVSEMNEAGGIKGKKIRLIVEDDQGLPQPAVSALQKLIDQDHVEVVIGGAFSTPALAMLPICDRRHVVLFSPTASSPQLSKPNDYFFRNWPSDTFEGDSMAQYAVKRLGLKTFAILYSNSDYGLGLREVFKKKVEEVGGTVVAEDGFTEGTTDFRAQVTKIKEASPQAMYMVGWYKEFAAILKQVHQLGLKVQILSCVTFNKPELLELAGEAAEGAIFTQPTYDPANNQDNVKRFVDSYAKRYGTAPGVYATHGYDAIRLLALAMEREGLATAAIMRGLYGITDYPGVSGLTTFNRNGDVAKPARIYTVRENRYVPID